MTNDDIVTRLREMIDGPIPFDASRRDIRDSLAEIEKLRRLCAHMASLLDDCRPADASIAWVMARVDTVEQWRDHRATFVTESG